LNRSFPGSKSGSLASRLANMFAREIVSKCTHGIDLHTGSHHRSNLPQIRACLDDSETRRLAALFGAPVMINSDVRDGSLRQYAHERGIHMLLYEAGEPLRLDRASIRLGVSGVVSIMKAIGMLPGSVKSPSRAIVPHKTQWVRAPVSGMFRASVPLGAEVSKSDRLGLIADPFGEGEKPVLSPLSGVVIGKLNLPLVHRGDALFNIGMSRYPGRTHEVLEAFREKYEPQDT